MANNTFATIAIETPDANYANMTVKFNANFTQTCTGFTANGTANYQITITSNGANQHVLSRANGTTTVTYCTISLSNATGGATWDANTGCVDDGNNAGWVFITAGGARYLVLKTSDLSSIFGRVLN